MHEHFNFNLPYSTIIEPLYVVKPGTITGTITGTGTAAAEAATKAAAEAAAKAAAETAARAAAEAAVKAAAEAAAKAAAEAAAKAAAKAAAEAAAKAAAEAAAKAAAEAAAKAAAEAAAKASAQAAFELGSNGILSDATKLLLKNTDDALKVADDALIVLTKSTDEALSAAQIAAKTADDLSLVAAKSSDDVLDIAKSGDEAANTAKDAALKAGKTVDEAEKIGAMAKAKTLLGKSQGLLGFVAAIGGVYMFGNYLYGKIKQDKENVRLTEQRENAKECYALFAECKLTKSEAECMTLHKCMEEAVKEVEKEQPEWWNCYKACYDSKIKEGKTATVAETECTEQCKEKEKKAGFQCNVLTPGFLCTMFKGLDTFLTGSSTWLKTIIFVIIGVIIFFIIFSIIKLFR